MLPNKAADRISKEIKRLHRELPQLDNIFNAFEDLFVAHAAFKEALPEQTGAHSRVDKDLFAKGVPLVSKTQIDFDEDYLSRAARAIIPSLKKGFPSPSMQFDKIFDAIVNNVLDLEVYKAVFAEQSHEYIFEASERIQVDTGVFQVAVSRLLKPLAEKYAEQFTPIPYVSVWTEGYCPVCGSWPEIDHLDEKEGFRQLRCSFCASEWQFPRLQCCFCKSDDQQKIELVFSEDRQHERATLCHTCEKYITGIDTRNLVYEFVPETAGISMVYLDILAQERGLTPGAPLLWNSLSTAPSCRDQEIC